MTAPQPPLTDAALDTVAAFAYQLVAYGLMPASSVEIETIRRLEQAYRAHETLLREIRAVVDSTAVHSTSMPYVQAHGKIASLLHPMPSSRSSTDEIALLRAALREACDWATPFNGRHVGGHASELLPMYTRVGDRTRADRLAELHKLADGLPGAVDEVARSRRLLLNILAVIHRDGGHHTERVGLEQSVEDAHVVAVAARHAALDEIAQLRAGLKEACEMVVTTDHEGFIQQPATSRVAELRKLADKQGGAGAK